MSEGHPNCSLGSCVAGLHDCPLKVEVNNFKYKSLSDFACNPCLGCTHGCRFCYVPDTAAVKQKQLLASYGVSDPSAEWGGYTLVRPFDPLVFDGSLRRAEGIPREKLTRDGNRAVMFSSTTDPYQRVRCDDAGRSKDLTRLLLDNGGRALDAILERSTLNVRILTRSPLATEHLGRFARFGNRLMLGVSLPTLDDGLSRIYEPRAPGPRQRLELLMEAHRSGIPTFVAIAPVYPECGYDDIRKTMEAVAEADPMTIFMEPINMRQGIAQLMCAELRKHGRDPDPSLLDPERWPKYAVGRLLDAERAARETGLGGRFHPWPDHERLGSARVRKMMRVDWQHPDGISYDEWLDRSWSRVSEWPGKNVADSGNGTVPESE